MIFGIMYLIIAHEIKVKLLINNFNPESQNKGWILSNTIKNVHYVFQNKNGKIEYIIIWEGILELKKYDDINEGSIEILSLRIAIKDNLLDYLKKKEKLEGSFLDTLFEDKKLKKGIISR